MSASALESWAPSWRHPLFCFDDRTESVVRGVSEWQHIACEHPTHLLTAHSWSFLCDFASLILNGTMLAARSEHGFREISSLQTHRLHWGLFAPALRDCHLHHGSVRSRGGGMSRGLLFRRSGQ